MQKAVVLSDELGVSVDEVWEAFEAFARGKITPEAVLAPDQELNAMAQPAPKFEEDGA